MKSIKFRPEIEDDIEDARVWYEGRRSGLADRFCVRVDEVFEQLLHPASVLVPIFGDVCFRRVNGFPYIVLFRDRPHRIEVIAVLHTSRDSEAWRSRLDES